MKKQKNPEEKKIRKIALKMTATFVTLSVIIEVLICVIILSVTRLAFETVPICIGIVCFDIVLAFAGYFDFKSEIIEWQKNDKENGNTK